MKWHRLALPGAKFIVLLSFLEVVLSDNSEEKNKHQFPDRPRGWTPGYPHMMTPGPNTWTQQKKLGKCFANPNDNLQEIARQCRCEVYSGDELKKFLLGLLSGAGSKGEHGGRDRGGEGGQGGQGGQGKGQGGRGGRGGRSTGLKSSPSIRKKRGGKDEKCDPSKNDVGEAIVGPMMVKKCFWSKLSLLNDGKVAYDKFKQLFDNFDIEPNVKEELHKAIDDCVASGTDPDPPLPDIVLKIVGILLPKDEVGKCICIEKALSGLCTDIGRNFLEDIQELLKKFQGGKGKWGKD